MRHWLGALAFMVLLSADGRAEAIIQNLQSYEDWIVAEPARATEVAALQAFLRRKGVAGVVPVRALLQGDRDRLRRCAGSGYVMPPRRLWPNIVPALKIIRDKVIPNVGRVEIVSAWRSPQLNACARGAPQSRHLSFSALDMIAPTQPDGRTLFAKLCSVWRQAGSRSGWGLGAYFDPSRPTANRQARFHVDATGWRSWGFSKKAASSGCRLLGK